MPPAWTRLAAGAGAWGGAVLRRSADRLLAAEESRPGPPAARALAETSTGVVAALVTLSHCLSYTALIFSGPLQAGVAYGLWTFLAGAAIGCILVALGSTLPPAIAGPRNAPLAVISVMAAAIGGHITAAGGSGEAAVANVLVAIALATVLTGLMLWLLGRLALGSVVRFVPFPVIAGFLAASGWFLITGGLRVAVGRELGPADLAGGLGAAEMVKALVALGFVAAVHVARRLGGGSSALIVAFFALALLLDAALWLAGNRAGWYLTSAAASKAWSPLAPAMLGAVDWRVLMAVAVEIGSVVGVAVIALLLDVSTLEAQRARIADMDGDFRANGLANVVIAPIGGSIVGLAPNASRLIDQLGGAARLSGVAAGLFLGFVLLSGLDVTAIIPTPVLGGLLVFLGLGVLAEALLPAPEQRSRLDLALTLAIMLAIVRLGYLTGVILGLVGACMMFAFRYSRIGAIRRHATRAAFAAPVERSPEATALLARDGGRIHVFWLSGYIFFGTSNGLFEDIRRLVGAGERGMSRWVVLDMTGVTGIDASAMLSFLKLRSWAHRQHVLLAFAGVPQRMRRRFEIAGLGDGVRGGGRAFATRGEALEWCEQGLIHEAWPEPDQDAPEAVDAWLAKELGPEPSRRLVERYLVRRELAAGDILCAQGEGADTIDLVANGSIAISFVDSSGRSVRVRRMTGRTVIGEMGFLRGADRTATVAAEEPTRVLTLTRHKYEAMLGEDPALAAAFLEFIGRTLADRVEFANKEVAVLL